MSSFDEQLNVMKVERGVLRQFVIYLSNGRVMLVQRDTLQGQLDLYPFDRSFFDRHKESVIRTFQHVEVDLTGELMSRNWFSIGPLCFQVVAADDRWVLAKYQGQVS